ncbi:MAG: CRISPR-associated endonuclease Cas2 [Candidatus Competibacteraceae bacterium]|nr:CRISPR-associated endonuclease Cas2 [Candidatus Competibacteraceae bacterium]MCB1805419.1 CRISPR-associated endonuclease Cas2 [Candidatus Competibacteraceae bacterium]MCB1811049.1 CRISPR-associated endonuclease Cas2 [Candidatus Competibacteraceae bacterium]
MKDWYLIAYDIRAPNRLRQVHYYLRKRALAMQQSVFFIEATPTELAEVLDTIAGFIKKNSDDVRAYPVPHPSQVWLSGRAAVQGPLLRLEGPEQEESEGFWQWLGRLWKPRHER